MEEINFTWDEEKELWIIHIKGVRGKDCELIEETFAKVLGDIKSSKKTAEYYLTPVKVKRTLTQKR